MHVRHSAWLKEECDKFDKDSKMFKEKQDKNEAKWIDHVDWKEKAYYFSKCTEMHVCEYQIYGDEVSAAALIVWLWREAPSPFKVR